LATGLTVGSTAISGGADGRVLFQNGGVVQESASFTYASGTLKLISSGTSESLLIRNSANTADIFSVLNGGAILNSFLQVNGGLNSYVQFNSTNNSRWVKVQHDYGQLEFTNSLGNNTFTLGNNGVSSFSGNVNIGGGTNGARLDVRAQGALSTDLALRVRNSANTQDWISVQGDGVVNVSNTLSSYKFFCQNFRLEADGATRINGGFLQLANNTYVYSYNQDLLLNCYSTGASRTNNVIIDHNSASNTGIQGDIKLLQLKYRGSTAQAVIFGDGGTVFGNQTKVASAKVQIDSTTQGFLPPRMTNAQRTAIATPAVGLMVYCTDATEGLYIYKSTGWTFVI
jgi:hypothetical protein